MSKYTIKALLACVWIVVFTLVFNFGLGLLTTPNTIANILGFFIIVIFMAITFETNCFTNFYKKK